MHRWKDILPLNDLVLFFKIRHEMILQQSFEVGTLIKAAIDGCKSVPAMFGSHFLLLYQLGLPWTVCTKRRRKVWLSTGEKNEPRGCSTDQDWLVFFFGRAWKTTTIAFELVIQPFEVLFRRHFASCSAMNSHFRLCVYRLARLVVTELSFFESKHQVVRFHMPRLNHFQAAKNDGSVGVLLQTIMVPCLRRPRFQWELLCYIVKVDDWIIITFRIFSPLGKIWKKLKLSPPHLWEADYCRYHNSILQWNVVLQLYMPLLQRGTVSNQCYYSVDLKVQVQNVWYWNLSMELTLTGKLHSKS